MKNLKHTHSGFVALVVILIAISCQKEEKTIVINGQITKPQSEYVIVFEGEKSDSLKVDANGRFKYQPPNLDERFVVMMIEKNLLHIIYVKPGSDILLEANGEELKNRNISGIKITGNGSEESSFLLELSKNEFLRSSEHKYTTLNLFKNKPEQFEKVYRQMLDENNAKYDQFLIDHPNGSTSFISDLKILDNVERDKDFSSYPRMHKIFGKDTVEYKYQFNKIGETVPLNNVALYKYNISYSSFIDNYFKEEFEKYIQNESSINANYITKYLDFYKNLEMKEIGERNVFKTIRKYINYPLDARQVLKQRYKEFVSNPSDIETIEKIITQTESLDKGKSAPIIEYPDINGNIISSANYAGKVIYVDLWATWCLPCKKEIPYLEDLTEYFKDNDNIVFISVAIKDNKERWEKMVKEKNMSGIQLYSGNTMNSKIARDYVINTIPRFIIIGKDGNIVNSDATKPSDPITKSILTSLLSNN